MIYNLLLSSFIFLLISSEFNIAYAESDTLFAHQIKEAITQEKLVGITWAAVSGNDIHVGSAGFANVASSDLMKSSQKMHVGSVAKTVLAMGVLRLISEEALSLDTNVEILLPELAFHNPWHDVAPVKVKNLLNHTAGLDNIRMWQFLSTIPTPNMPLQYAFPSSNRKLLKIRTEPGTQYSYSNMGYTLLAMVIEAVTKQRYEDYLDKHFLAPLGMLHSSFKFVTQQGDNADPALAMGYFENNVSQAAIPSYLRPAGQFTTTAPDMARFINLILNNGELNGVPFIRFELIARLAYPEGTNAHKAGLNIGHGLVFFIRDRHQAVGMCHPGETIGFRANICLYPEEKKGFFYAINTDNETSNYEKLNLLFIRHLSINQATVAKPSSQPIDLSKLKGIFLRSPNNMAEFEFLDMLFNFMWIEPSEGKLLLKSLQSKDRILNPVSGSLLRAVDRTQASHVVYTNKEGGLFFTDGLKTFRKRPFALILSYWLSLVFGMFGLLYIILSGVLRIVRRDRESFKVISWPFINIFAFIVPVYFFTNQSFLEFGDVTAASISLAIITGLLPVTLSVSLLLWIRGKVESKWRIFDGVALFMSIQLCLVLLGWEVIPIVSWR